MPGPIKILSGRISRTQRRVAAARQVKIPTVSQGRLTSGGWFGRRFAEPGCHRPGGFARSRSGVADLSRQGTKHHRGRAVIRSRRGYTQRTGTTTLGAALRAVLGRGPVCWQQPNQKAESAIVAKDRENKPTLTTPDAGLERCLAGSRGTNSRTADPPRSWQRACWASRPGAHYRRHR